MTDISATGLQVQIVASNTFPAGFTVSQFADDADPLDSASIQIADSAMTLNGEQVSWSMANSIPVTINVIPGTDEDINLSILHEANRVGLGKTSARDKITAVVIYPGILPTTLSGGLIKNGPSLTSTAGTGRKKTKAYEFSFENKTGA